jgi:hypothetical protein
MSSAGKKPIMANAQNFSKRKIRNLQRIVDSSLQEGIDNRTQNPEP